MKNLIAIILLTTSFCGVSHYEHNYTRDNCRIIQINDGMATIEDSCGFVWDWDIEAEDLLKIGDNVSLKMHDSFTSGTVEDDIIKEVVKK